MNKETWKSIKGYEGLYEISDMGRIKSLKWKGGYKTKISYGHDGDRGYKTYALTKDGKIYKTGIHRLVYCTFNNVDFKDYDPLRKTIVCHKNDIKTDNRLENLFLGTAKDNFYDMYNKGRGGKMCVEGIKGSKNNFAKLTETKVKLIKLLLSMGVTHREIGEQFGVSRSCIGNINTGYTWSHLTI